MTRIPTEAREWTQPRWWRLVLGILATQLVLVFVLSTRGPAPAPPAPRAHRMSLATSPTYEAARRESGWLDNPAEMALVSERGFSGPTWRRLPRFQPAMPLWSESPRWLTQDQGGLGAIAAPAPALAAPPVAGVESPPAYVPAPGLAPDPARTNSTVRVEGELGRRTWAAKPELPGWPYPDVLAPTTVQVMVDRDGLVLSATVLSSSGLAEADQRALQVARNARFEANAAAGGTPAFAWGRLVFQWQVLPVATNAP